MELKAFERIGHHRDIGRKSTTTRVFNKRASMISA
jgi:hypothetical protein